MQARVQVNSQYYNHPIYTVYNVVLGPQVQHCRRDHNGYGNDEIRARRDQASISAGAKHLASNIIAILAKLAVGQEFFLLLLTVRR